MFNLLDSENRPVGRPERDPVLPRYPSRLRAFKYGCAKAALIIDGKLKNTNAPKPPPRRRRK